MNRLLLCLALLLPCSLRAALPISSPATNGWSMGNVRTNSFAAGNWFNYDINTTAPANSGYWVARRGGNEWRWMTMSDNLASSNAWMYVIRTGITPTVTISNLYTLDEAYGAGWDGSSGVPTKNAVYDAIAAIGGATNGILKLNGVGTNTTFYQNPGDGTVITLDGLFQIQVYHTPQRLLSFSETVGSTSLFGYNFDTDTFGVGEKVEIGEHLKVSGGQAGYAIESVGGSNYFDGPFGMNSNVTMRGPLTITNLTASKVVITTSAKNLASTAATSSQGVAGDGSAITFGSGLSLAAGTLTASGGGVGSGFTNFPLVADTMLITNSAFAGNIASIIARTNVANDLPGFEFNGADGRQTTVGFGYSSGNGTFLFGGANDRWLFSTPASVWGVQNMYAAGAIGTATLSFSPSARQLVGSDSLAKLDYSDPTKIVVSVPIVGTGTGNGQLTLTAADGSTVIATVTNGRAWFLNGVAGLSSGSGPFTNLNVFSALTITNLSGNHTDFTNGSELNTNFLTGSYSVRSNGSLTLSNLNGNYVSLGVGAGGTGPATNIITAVMALSTVPSNGVANINPTPATSGNQKVSPAVMFEGQGFATTGSTSGPVRLRIYVQPVQGAANSTPNLLFEAQSANGAWATVATFTSTGAYTTPGTVNAASVNVTGNSTLTTLTTLTGDTTIGSGGIATNGGGFKHGRFTTGSVSAGSTALVTCTWGSAFADTNYTVSASVADVTGSSLSLSVVHVEAINTTDVQVRVINNAVGALTGNVHVTAIHD